MGTLTMGFLLILGLLAVFPDLERRGSPVAGYLRPLIPYQQGIGAIAVFLGLLSVLLTIIGILRVRYYFLAWLVELAAGVLEVSLGLILGHELVNQMVLGKNATLKKWAREWKDKAERKRNVCGYTAIGVFALNLLLRLAY